METISLSVRRLIEFVMRSGDIDNSYRSTQRMLEGIRAHKKIQDAYEADYQREVTFREDTEIDGICFHVEGRADGLYEGPDGPMIDEIKSTTRSLSDLDPTENVLHWAQAKCYAHFYCRQNEVSDMRVQLTYVNLDEEPAVKRSIQRFSAEELQNFYEDLLHRFLVFSRAILSAREARDASLATLQFPYPSYRPGQRVLSVGIYRAIEGGKRLFLEAPTGIGKTMSALVPALASIRTCGTKKIFYTTARTTTQREVSRALERLAAQGLVLKSIRLTAKERLCPNDEMACNPVDCSYAKGHFDRVNAAILDLYETQNLWTREQIDAYAQAHHVCPFELQLDMSDYADLVVGDYNYVFDPQVYLRRAFEEPDTAPVVLVDEAHNLVDRGREMYSASLYASAFVAMQKIFPAKSHHKLHALLKKAEQLFWASHRQLGGAAFCVDEKANASLYECIEEISRRLDPFLTKQKAHPQYDEVLDFRFQLAKYARIFETWQDGFFTFLRAEDGDLCWRLQCIDTEGVMKARLSLCKAAVFFSATLSPMRFYQELLGGGEEALGLRLPSPFPPENLAVFQADVSARYRDRARTVPEIAAYLQALFSAKGGNYMVFFPSYTYLQQVAEAMHDEELLVQEPQWTQEERQAVFARYEEEQNVKGFFVLGGLFAEGIDLVGRRLIGVAVISPGLPGLSEERNVVKSYFDRKKQRGFDYAYIFPGMNKVLQAGGRVIRSAADRGVILLLDDRFGRDPYRALLPAHWSVQSAGTPLQLTERVQKFWQVSHDETKKEESGEL